MIRVTVAWGIAYGVAYRIGWAGYEHARAKFDDRRHAPWPTWLLAMPTMNETDAQGAAPSGRRERLQREEAGARARAQAELQSVIRMGATDEEVRAAWWRAVHLGCALDPELRRAGRAACTREQRRLLVELAGPPRLAADPVPSHFPQPSAPSLGQLLAVTELDQSRALEQLREALSSGDRRRIARAAEVARMASVPAAGIDWAEVADAEALVACEGELRAALRVRDTSGAAAAWARATAGWGGALDPADDAAGREMFRAWGHTMRGRPDRGHAS